MAVFRASPENADCIARDGHLAVDGTQGDALQEWLESLPAQRKLSRSRLERVLWMNLDRRHDRAATHLAALDRAGLTPLAERVSAVDGRQLDVQKINDSLLNPKGKEQALLEPEYVLGRVLTPGAIGLWLTWHKVLTRISKEATSDDCFLVMEDDADYVDGFQPKLAELLAVLDAFDPSWHVLAIGYIRSKTRIKPLLGDNPVEGLQGILNSYFGRPGKLCGAPAIVIRGPEAAERLLRELFPVGADCQFDYRISTARTLNFYMAAEPLAAAPLSEAGDTDIQRIPEARRLKLQLDARIRHALGDQINVEERAVEELRRDGTLDSLIGSFVNDPKLSADAMGPALDTNALVAEVARAQALNKVNNGPVIAWSLDGPFGIIGSWNDWKSFQVMERVAGTPTYRAVIKPVQAGKAVEFQIAFDSDWKRRFFPESPTPGASIFGPADRHGKNWVLKVPRNCVCITVVWNPAGMRRLDVEFERMR